MPYTCPLHMLSHGTDIIIFLLVIRWNEAAELATFDYFDVNAILSYLVRINIVARWTLLDAARGREMFARLLAELDGKELINKE